MQHKHHSQLSPLKLLRPPKFKLHPVDEHRQVLVDDAIPQHNVAELDVIREQLLVQNEDLEGCNVRLQHLMIPMVHLAIVDVILDRHWGRTMKGELGEIP